MQPLCSCKHVMWSSVKHCASQSASFLLLKMRSCLVWVSVDIQAAWSPTCQGFWSPREELDLKAHPNQTPGIINMVIPLDLSAWERSWGGIGGCLKCPSLWRVRYSINVPCSLTVSRQLSRRPNRKFPECQEIWWFGDGRKLHRDLRCVLALLEVMSM